MQTTKGGNLEGNVGALVDVGTGATLEKNSGVLVEATKGAN